MKYTEEQFKKEVELKHNGEFEVISRFKGLTKPILIKSKYGILEYKSARDILKARPTILRALNKTEYFLNILKEKHPNIAEELIPKSEYIAAKKSMLFETKFGLISTEPDTLLAGHMPTIRRAVNRKEYFYNQLQDLYREDDYDFIINSTNRKEGRTILICKEHGEQSIDTDWLFSGCGCPECNKGWEKSTTFYLIRLTSSEESFYKLGVSYRIDNTIRRYKDYEKLGYSIEELKTKDFDDYIECLDFETKLRRLIKNNLYTPKNWEHKTSLECFKDNTLDLVLNNI